MLYFFLNVSKTVYFLPLFLVWLLPTLAISLYSVSNSSVFTSPWLLSSEPNILLLNSVNKYHPLLLYLVFFSIVNINFLGSQRFYYPKTAFSAVEGKQLFIFSALTAFTMFWGSWWAYQEGSWGG
jgi:hypothetical protein